MLAPPARPRQRSFSNGACHAPGRPHKATPAQAALAWMLAKPGITAPIASATNLDQFADLVKAGSLRLAAKEVAALDAASAA